MVGRRGLYIDAYHCHEMDTLPSRTWTARRQNRAQKKKENNVSDATQTRQTNTSRQTKTHEIMNNERQSTSDQMNRRPATGWRPPAGKNTPPGNQVEARQGDREGTGWHIKRREKVDREGSSRKDRSGKPRQRTETTNRQQPIGDLHITPFNPHGITR